MTLSPQKDEMELVVSNNCSTDNTAKLLNELSYRGINFRIIHQPQNIGFDLNCQELYKESKGKYVWYFGDDDIIFENTVQTIFDCVKDEKYCAMRFEFMQPIGSTAMDFWPYDGAAEIITDPGRIAISCFTLPKVSAYVLRRIESVTDVFSTIKKYENQGYWFIALAVRVCEMLEKTSEGMIIYHKQLASSDSDVFEELNVPPEVWNNRTVIAEYPYVKLHCPTFAAQLFKQDYRSTIEFLWKYKTGEHKVHNPEECDAYIKKIKIRMQYLRSRRKLLFKLIILKSGLFPLYTKLNNIKTN